MKLSTFSIIGFDKESGCLGGASASFYPGLGAFSPYIFGHKAVIASQGWLNPLLNADIAAMLAKGVSAQQALTQALAQDAKAYLRQVSVVTFDGQVAAQSGEGNDDYCGHRMGKGYVIAGNALANLRMLEAMEEAYLGSGSFSQRLLAALVVGDESGGDRRGKKAAVLRVDNVEGFPYIDFRVDDSDTAVADLARIFQRNYESLHKNYLPWVEAGPDAR